MKTYLIKYVEFYITNVCNFNCDNCNRFNNYHFTGQQSWDEYKDDYIEWRKRFDLEFIAILGGEPTLNPSFLKWVDGIASLWQDSTIEIVTNASRINNIKGFYSVLKEYGGRVFLGVSIHNLNHADEIHDSIMEFLGDDVSVNYMDDKDAKWKKAYNDIKDPQWDESFKLSDYDDLPMYIQDECSGIYNDINNHNGNINTENLVVYEDNNGVRVVLTVSNEFSESAIINNDGVFSLHDSDPQEAIDVCYSKHCHHFVKGKLYKCGVVPLLPEFYEQFEFNIDDSDIELIHSYEPLTLETYTNRSDSFMDNLLKNEVIPQCKFCPSNPSTTTISASMKKERIRKKKS